jgi:hypothetical protein
MAETIRAGPSNLAKGYWSPVYPGLLTLSKESPASQLNGSSPWSTYSLGVLPIPETSEWGLFHGWDITQRSPERTVGVPALRAVVH